MTDHRTLYPERVLAEIKKNREVVMPKTVHKVILGARAIWTK